MDAFSDARPTLYEIYMQERLSGLLLDALHFTFTVISSHFPRLTPFRYYLPDISATLVSIIDVYFLRTTQGTHSEQFYGLKRNMKTDFFALMKYVLVTLFPKIAFQRVFGRGMRTIETIFSVVKTGFMVQYLYFQGRYYSPQYYLLGHTLERGMAPSTAKVGFFLGILVLKALEFWFQSAKEAGPSAVAQVQPPFTSSAVPRNICGICRKQLVNPTALDVSGYVFCYTCLKSHVDTFGSCPITGESALVQNLRKVHR